MHFRSLPPLLKAYVFLLALAAGAASFALAPVLPASEPWLVAVLLITSFVVSTWRIDLPLRQTHHTLNSALTCLAMLLQGPTAALACAVVGATVSTLTTAQPGRWLPRLRLYTADLYRWPFNVAAAVLATACAAAAYTRVVPVEDPQLADVAAGALVFQAVQFLLCSVATATGLGFMRGGGGFQVWRDSYLWTAPSYLLSGSLAAVLAEAAAYAPYRALVLLVLPPLYFLYHFHRIYLDRMKLHAEREERDRRHIAELSELNASIIASLATAIDAKDRYTRAHISRVQAYAVSLAEAAGVHGPELEAVRTGALIHDIGKLGIPERILGKPGKLTPEEFERMKAHVHIGVEILKPVNFPYPVKPIVLTHHERWDGLGYPQGLRGEEIPIGGRIMAIADVFDALTSTRPYRSAMSPDDALSVILDGAGRHFDPDLACVFARILPGIRGRIDELERLALDPGATFDRPGSLPADGEGAFSLISQAAAEMSATCELAQGLAATATVREVVEVVVDRALRLLPADTAVLYLCQEATGELCAEGCRGLYAAKLRGLTIHRGEGVSGWVAETLQVQVNAQAGLDIARRFNPNEQMELSSATAVPLVQGNATLGVLSLYTTGYCVLSAHHLGVLNVLSEHAVAAITSARRFEETRELSLTDPLTGLPNSRSLVHHVETLCRHWEGESMGRVPERFAVLMFDLDGFKQINDTRGHLLGDQVLQDFAGILSRLSREEDLPCRYAGDEFVVVLADADAEAADQFARRVRAALAERTALWGIPWLDVSEGAACFPRDGRDVPSLLAVADERMYSDKFGRRPNRVA